VTRRAARTVVLALAALLLGSCARVVPLHLGPIALVVDLALLEVRVWNGAACPADPRTAADPATLDDVAVVRYFDRLSDAPPIGAFPSGPHAVSVVVRHADCQIVLYGCTPSVDLATATEVRVDWATVAGPACEAGFACESGACFEPRTSDASSGDGGR
jgi:hypothetical protein